MKKLRTRFKSFRVLILFTAAAFLLPGCKTFKNLPNEFSESKSYLLRQTHNAPSGGVMLQESRMSLMPYYAALRDVKIGAPVFSTIKRDMVFKVVREYQGNYLIWNSDVFYNNPTLAIEIKKDGTLAAPKPLYSMIYMDNWARGTQQAWDVAPDEKVFQRFSEPGSFDRELLYRGKDDTSFYLLYREKVPATGDTAYQEYLKFDLKSAFLEILSKEINILSVDSEQIVFVVEKDQALNGPVVLPTERIVRNPSLDPDITKTVREETVSEDPKDAFLRMMELYRRNFFGLFYDGLDNYTKGKMDTMIELVASAAGSEYKDLKGRDLFIHSMKPGVANGKLSLTFIKESNNVANVTVKEDKALIEIETESGEMFPVHMLLENGQWKLRLADDFGK